MEKKKRKNSMLLPMVALRGLVAFPHTMLHFDCGRNRSLKAIEKAMEEDSLLFGVAQRDPSVEVPTKPDLFLSGTIIRIKQIFHLPDGALRVLGYGESAASLIAMQDVDGVPYAEVQKHAEPHFDVEDNEIETMVRMVKESFAHFAQLRDDMPPELLRSVMEEQDIPALCGIVATNAIHSLSDQQTLVDFRTPTMSLMILLELLEREIEIQNLQKRIRGRMQVAFDKGQKEHYLREQIKAIRTELGDGDDQVRDQLQEKLDKSPIHGPAREMVERELKRMGSIAPGAPELSVIQSYIEFALELPWAPAKEKSFKIDKARKILEGDHYGLEKVKERVLEYLALRAINPEGKAPILCLVGAPGVGKTSTARSISNALNRKFVRMSLGGLYDESEIRGHRRTYVGAMPGRILSLIRQAGTDNPVFLLDEIDKLGQSMHGDPASALLEALDPEQNKTYSDNYLEAPYDLSRVLFVTTANASDTIPAPLLDRMELIEVNSYTLEEKVQIAKRHLWPKQLKEHALTKAQVKLSDSLLRYVIESYTAEAGVRTLERQLQTILRKTAVKLLETPEEERKPIVLTQETLESYLGVPYPKELSVGAKPETGVVNGLAWTSIGGKTMPIEATVMPGSGRIELTGQLGDVMKESARTAYSYLRSHSEQYAIETEFAKTSDMHIHVPAGAVPKDGPSAGVALTCAMLSAITGKPARQDIAMTGEITLRGKVLPIGGVKEKLLAAYRLGIKTVLVPEDNRKDLVEIPTEVRKKLDVRTISGVDQAIDILFDIR